MLISFIEMRSDVAKDDKPLSVQNQHHCMQRHFGSMSIQTCRQRPSRFRLIRWASEPEWKLAGRALLTTAWRKAKCCLGDEAVEKNLFVLLPRQQAVDWRAWWEGGGPERRKRGERGRRLWKGVKGKRFWEGKRRDDKSWSQLLEAQWKFEPRLYYSLHLCLVYAGWVSAAWENLQFSVTSSQTKLVSRFFWVRRNPFFPPLKERQLKQETLRWLFPWARFSSPASLNYLNVFHLLSWPLERLLLFFLASFSDIKASSGATFITLIQIFYSRFSDFLPFNAIDFTNLSGEQKPCGCILKLPLCVCVHAHVCLGNEKVYVALWVSSQQKKEWIMQSVYIGAWLQKIEQREESDKAEDEWLYSNVL